MKIRGILLFLVVLVANQTFAEERLKHMTVQKDDWLSKYAQRYLNDVHKWPEFLKYNNIPDPNLIEVGQKVKIPFSMYKGSFGTVALCLGKCEVMFEDSDKWQSLAVDQQLYLDDTVKTASGSEIEITLLNNKSSVTVAADTTVNLRKLSEKSDRKKTKIELLIGKLRLKGNHPEEFRVETETAVAIVRGTDFTVEQDQAKTMRVAVSQGAVEVVAGGKSIMLHDGEGTYVEYGKAPVAAFRLPETPKNIKVETEK